MEVDYKMSHFTLTDGKTKRCCEYCKFKRVINKLNYCTLFDDGAGTNLYIPVNPKTVVCYDFLTNQP